MSFICCRMALPIRTAFAESPGEKANGLATINLGAFATGWAPVRAPRGMPCAANGATTMPAESASTIERNRDMLEFSLTKWPALGQQYPAQRGCEWAKRDSNPRHP